LLKALLSKRLPSLEAIRDERCSRDSLYWAQNFTLTENPKWKEQGLPFRAPFPKKSYFIPLFEKFRNSRRLFIPKSREMLSSWCVMIWATNQAQWHQAEVIVQTNSEEKAKQLISYARILYENQAEWLRHRHPLREDATQMQVAWADGGRVFGIPKDEHKVRMWHPTIMIFDEIAFLEGAKESYNAAHPVAGQIVGISSAGPGWFGNECESRESTAAPIVVPLAPRSDSIPEPEPGPEKSLEEELNEAQQCILNRDSQKEFFSKRRRGEI
jgi:hypothetical protein